jgi:hypothetical protein
MFTKTLIALALSIGTASSAMAATKHQSAPSGHDKSEARVISEPAQQDMVEFVVGNMLFVGFHEMGHALAGQLRLPILGRAEDAADSFATLALLDEGSEFSVNVLVQAARGMFLMDRRDRKNGDAPDFFDAHSLDQQRAFQIVCLMIGSDAKQFKELADRVQLPESRQRSCRDDYDSAKNAWQSVLKPHQRSTDQPNSTVEIAYETGHGKLDNYARSFRSIRLLETFAGYVSNRYVLPRPIALIMKSCGGPNAWWDPPTLSEAICYELADDFVDLYQGYTTSQRKIRANKLVSKNVGRIHVAQNTSRESLAAGSGLPEARVNGDQLEKLALNLEGEAAAFFTQTANRKAAPEAKPTKRR